MRKRIDYNKRLMQAALSLIYNININVYKNKIKLN